MQHRPQIPDFTISIVYLEMINIIMVLRVWAHFWQYLHIMYFVITSQWLVCSIPVKLKTLS